ncbi:MAG: CapA family protein [Syntrophomonas sp.]
MLRRFGIMMLLIVVGSIASLNIYAYTQPVQTVISPVGNNKEIEKTHIETVTLIAAGDCLMHNTQIAAGLQPDGSYRFDHFFTEVQDLIGEGDYSSTNFEAAMAGPASGYTGYPMFNSPDAAAKLFKNAGFDLVVSANNHCLDRGCQGALRTLDVLHQAGLDTVGTYKSQADSKSFLIRDIRGVKVGYLAYTYGTNGIPVPAQYSFLVNFIDKSKIMADIKKLRPQVDILALVLHWGLEYNPQPTPEQKVLAREFFEAGADVILGSHPHVIQTMEVIKVAGQDKFVIYSMGNFVSHQIGQERNSGIVLKMKFKKDFSNNKTTLEEVSYTPTFSQSYRENGKFQFRVVPVEESIAKIKAGQEPHMGSDYLPVLQSVLASTRSQLGSNFVRQ